MSTNNGIPTTNGYQQQVWSLDDLYTGFDAPEIAAAHEAIERVTQAIEAYRPRLSADLAADEAIGLVREIMDQTETLFRVSMRLFAFGYLRFSQDTQDQQAQVHIAQTQELMAGVRNRILFFELWWKGLDDDVAAAIMADSAPYTYYLEGLRRERPYTLSEAEERVLNIKNVNGPGALRQLYDTITNRYLYELEVDGEVKKLTRGELAVFIRGSDPEMRARAYQVMLQKFAADAPVLGQIYQFRVRDWRAENVTLRDHASPIAVRNLANDIPDSVVDTLLDVAKRNAGLFQRFFALKARWLGVDKLRRYDIYAPVTATAEAEYDFDAAVTMVLDSFAAFEPELATLARDVFDAGHYDSEVRPNKDTGAFCMTVSPDLTPWVLQSFQGRAQDIATMAHELGHAVHAMLASHLPAPLQQASLPLAETASTFGEMLLLDKLLAEEPSPDVRRDMLFRQMDDNYATIMRQIFFALFEREAHAAVARGASIDALCELYMENLVDQFGAAVELSDDFQYEWLSIPHIYSVPFYVYAYGFGQLLVLSLYEEYRQLGDAFKPRYMALLAAGGSDAPERILRRAGVDIHSADFWQGGFNVLSRLLDQLEALPQPAEA